MSHYLTLKGVGSPIAYFPKLAIYLDSVTASVFLCQMIYWHDKAHSELGVYKTSEEIREETGLTYREQATARKKLSLIGLITETHKKLEHRIYFKFNPDVFDEWLSGCLGIEIPERRKRISGHAESAIRETTKAQSVIHKNTTENTSKEYTVTFEKFWDEYPKCKRKGSKSDAYKTYKKFESKSDLIIQVLKKFKDDPSFLKNDGEFIPAPSSWLNKKHWENEYWLDAKVEVATEQQGQPQPVRKAVAVKKNYLEVEL